MSILKSRFIANNLHLNIYTYIFLDGKIETHVTKSQKPCIEILNVKLNTKRMKASKNERECAVILLAHVTLKTHWTYKLNQITELDVN